MTTPEIDYRPFVGDGRLKVGPNNFARVELYGSSPVELTRSQCRMLIGMLLRFGRSDHSRYGNTLWALIIYCRVQGLKHTVLVHRIDGHVTGFTLEVQ